ncbi:hypothetical protein HaLaN_22857 [Haematococcus lacustris]|uniref:Uncharacterized protein n=1 Tax=Haematococcus lacustris TaxID=44745 RepID=A0A6A0A430_HAELA|nr:hypothetical protein HaLaN_22857 [Haematococcus lacustris]
MARTAIVELILDRRAIEMVHGILRHPTPCLERDAVAIERQQCDTIFIQIFLDVINTAGHSATSELMLAEMLGVIEKHDLAGKVCAGVEVAGGEATSRVVHGLPCPHYQPLLHQ